MKKTFLILSLTAVLAACNGTGTSTPKEDASAVASDSTQVADSTQAPADTTAAE